MGYHLPIKKILITVSLNILFELFFLSLGGNFLFTVFLLPIVNLYVIAFFTKEMVRKHQSFLMLLLAILLTIIPILYMNVLGDAGSSSFMTIFVFFLIAIPSLFISGFAFFTKKPLQESFFKLMFLTASWQVVFVVWMSSQG